MVSKEVDNPSITQLEKKEDKIGQILKVIFFKIIYNKNYYNLQNKYSKKYKEKREFITSIIYKIKFLK
jgi:hypothetical protein